MKKFNDHELRERDQRDGQQDGEQGGQHGPEDGGQRGQYGQPLQRMHLIAFVFFIVKSAKDLVYPLIVFLLTTVFRGNVNWTWFIVSIGFLAILLIVLGLVQWLRFGYSLENAALRVEHGVFVRKKVWISRDRVQSVNTSAGIFHRPLGLVKLEVQTAGGTKPEAVLSAITAEQAEYVKDVLLKRTPQQQKQQQATDANGIGAGPAAQDQAEAAAAPHSSPLSHEAALEDRRTVIPLKHLLLYSSTSGQIGIVLAVFGTIFSQLDKWLKTVELGEWFRHVFGPLWGVWAGILVILLAWITAFVAVLFTEFNYSLSIKNDKLVIEKGLLERKQILIALERIQAVHLVENLLRRPFGLVCVRVVAAGYGGKEGKTGLLFPIVHQKDVQAFLNRYIPQAIVPEQWQPVKKRALRNYVLLPVSAAAAVSAALIIFVPDQWGWASLILPLAALWWSMLRFRHAAWSIDGQQLAIRMGGFTRQTAFIPKRRVQWHEVTQHPFQQRRRLATFHAALASSGGHADFRFRHGEEADMRRISAWLANRAKSGPQ